MGLSTYPSRNGNPCSSDEEYCCLSEIWLYLAVGQGRLLLHTKAARS